MDITAITLSLFLGVACIALGRSLIITERLRRRDRKANESLKRHREVIDHKDAEISILRRFLAAIQAPYTFDERKFSIKSFENMHVLYLNINLAEKEILIPIKTFFADDGDSEFAFNEACELKDKLEEKYS